MEPDALDDQAWDAFDRRGSTQGVQGTCSAKWRHKAVATTKTSSFDDAEGTCFVMGVATKRTFCHDERVAVKHAQHLMATGGPDEYLIVKVVGRVKRCLPEVEYTPIKD